MLEGKVKRGEEPWHNAPLYREYPIASAVVSVTLQFNCSCLQMNEDCLNLVVYVPSKLTKRVETNEGYYYELIDDITTAQLPVMVFFHGGAFITGGNGVTLYDGRFISEKGGVIVVTVNYR